MSRVLAAAIAAVLVFVGAPRSAIVVAVAMIVSPLVAMGAAVFVVAARWISGRRPISTTLDAASLYRELAAAVASGSDLRSAVRLANSPAVSAETRRLCSLGAPMRHVARSMEGALGETGPEFVAIAAVSETVGSALSGTLGLLASQCDQREQAVRDARVATAQSRFSALVVGVVPLVIAASIVAVNGVPDPAGPEVVIPMVGGALLMAAGSAIVLLVSRKAVV